MSGEPPGGQTGISRLALGASIAALLAVIAGFSWVAIKSFDLIHGGEIGTSGLKPVKLTGPEQTVFSWRKDACQQEDIPDLPARAFRDATGRVHLIASHVVTRAEIGSNLNQVRHDCRAVMRSRRSAKPQLYANLEWIASPYTLDGKTVFALVHDEYHGDCAAVQYLDCWYNAVTLARSDDGGSTFRDAFPPPDQLVAEVPYRWDPATDSRYGVFSPSNIVKKGAYYYAMALTEPYRAQESGTCLMRTANLADPTAWRAWNGDGFDVKFVDPYKVKNADNGDHFCKPVSFSQISTMVQSLTYNTYFGKYLLVGISAAYDPAKRRVVDGFYYSLSDDLIHWSTRKLLREVELLSTYRCGDPDPVLYPSVIDPGSASRNFETTGQHPYLYFTRFHFSACQPTFNRDLVRVPIEFSK